MSDLKFIEGPLSSEQLQSLMICAKLGHTTTPAVLVALLDQLDAQRLRADTAESELKALRHPMNSAQQLRKEIAAAEQRIAELTDVERVTMAILGKDKDPSPGVNWNAHRMWRVNDVRELVRAALNPNPNPEAESHE